jgi:hypothetical protein
MKTVFILLASLLAVSAQAGTLQNIALRSTDSFSKCAAEKANAEFIRSTAKIYFVMGTIESEDNPAKLASLRFFVNDPNLQNKIFKLLFVSSDAKDGWQIIQGNDGEIYAFSTAVESFVELTTDKGQSLGHLDLTQCK